MPGEQTQTSAALRSSALDRSGVLILGAAVVYATAAQGAFSAGAATVVVGLVGLAALIALVGRRRRPRHVLVTACLLLLLALWTAGRADDGPDGLRAAVAVVAVAAAVWAVAGLGARARDVLTAVLVVCGLLVAGSGWVGVAWHLEPLALVSSGLWRASATLTYANAAAAFLVTVLLLTSAAERLGTRASRLVSAALLVGLLATLSRAGLLALLVGLAVAGCSRAYRRRLAALWPVLPGAAVAAAGLLPGLAVESAPQPAAAGVALAAGLGVVALVPAARCRAGSTPAGRQGTGRRRVAAHRRVPSGAASRVSVVGHPGGRAAAHRLPSGAGTRAQLVVVGGSAAGASTGRRASSVVVDGGPAAGDRAPMARRVVALALVVLPAVGGVFATTALAQAAPVSVLDALVATPLSADSPERDDLRRVTLDQFRSAPLAGVGTGRLDLVYVDHTGTLVAAEYTHDEFLQTAAETGLVGAALVVAVFSVLAVAAFRRRHLPGGPPAAAVLVAFAAHSAFDFLWHIPVLPLLVAAAVVLLLDRPTHHEEEVTG